MSIEKRGKKYLVRIYKGGSKSFDSRKEAVAYESQILNFRSNNPNVQVTSKALFSEVAKSYLKNIDSTKEYNTYKSYESKFRIWIEPILGNFQIGNITPLTIIKFKEKLKEKDIGDSTFDLVNIVLYEIMNFASSSIERYIIENPAVKVERRQAITRPLSHDDYLDLSEAEKFIKSAKDTPYYNSVVFILNTGLRFNEFACLQKDYFDLNSKTFGVYQQICHRKKDGADFFIKPTKGKEHRSLPLNHVAFSVAKKEIETAAGLFLFCPGNTQPKKILIKKGNKSHVETHKIITNRTFAYAIAQICKLAGIKRIGPHGLRHTFAAHFLMNGGDIFALSKLLGHKSINTTIDRYGHLSKEYMANSVKIVSFGESR